MAVERSRLESVDEGGDTCGDDETGAVDVAHGSPALEGDSEPLSRRVLHALHELDVAAGRQASRMLREARDPGPEKPLWYTLTLVILFVGACLGIVFPVIGAILSTLAVSTTDAMGASQLVQAVGYSVKKTLEIGSSPLGLPPNLLWKAWSLSGIALFFAALFGTSGGKIGWTLFGGSTLLLAVLGAPSEARAATGSIVTIGWGILAVAIFRSTRSGRRVVNSDRKAPSGRRKMLSPRELAEAQAKGLGFDDLSDYFDNRGNKSVDEIRKDLGIREPDVKELRRELAGIERGGGMSPADRRAALVEATAEGADINEIAKKYGTTPKTLRALVE